MSGQFAFLCTGNETVADVLADAKAHGYVSVAEDIRYDGPAAALRAVIKDARERQRRGRRVIGANVGLAWRAYRASRRLVDAEQGR